MATPIEDPDMVLSDPDDDLGDLLRDWRDDVRRGDE
jgi:hypothetical protein